MNRGVLKRYIIVYLGSIVLHFHYEYSPRVVDPGWVVKLSESHRGIIRQPIGQVTSQASVVGKLLSSS